MTTDGEPESFCLPCVRDGPKAEKLTKFDARAVQFRFIGYSEHDKVYQFQDIKSDRVLVSREAQFMEDVFDGGKRSH